jgi:hypothetical protein
VLTLDTPVKYQIKIIKLIVGLLTYLIGLSKKTYLIENNPQFYAPKMASILIEVATESLNLLSTDKKTILSPARKIMKGIIKRNFFRKKN